MFVIPPGEATLDAREVAELLGVSYDRVLDLTRDGTIPFFQLGKERRYLGSALVRLMNEWLSTNAAISGTQTTTKERSVDVDPPKRRTGGRPYKYCASGKPKRAELHVVGASD